MKRPDISVIIPVFNTGKCAIKLVNFILSHNTKGLEIIIIDDGSTDDSLAVLKSIEHPAVKIFHKSNGGAASARNYGIKKASGRYLSFIDSDDFITEGFFSSLLSAISKKTVALAMTGVEYYRLKDNVSFPAYPAPQPPRHDDESYKAYILRLMNVDGRLYSVTNKLFHANIIQENHILFDTTMDFAEDTKFVLSYLNHIEGEIAWIPDPLFIYNYGTNTSIVAKSSLKWSNWQKSYDFLTKWLGPNPSQEERKNLKKIHFRWKISHALAVARSNLSLQEKLQLINLPLLFFASVAVKFRR